MDIKKENPFWYPNHALTLMYFPHDLKKIMHYNYINLLVPNEF